MLPGVAATYTFADQIVAVPYGVSTPLLFFDAVEFRAAGLDPENPPSTVIDLIEASRKVRASGVSPYGLVLFDWIGHWVLEQYAARRDLLVGTPDNGHVDGRPIVDVVSDAAVADLELFRFAVKEGHAFYLGPNPSNYAHLLKIVDPVDGGTMTIHTSASIVEVSGLIAAGSFSGVELGIGPLPGPGTGSLVGGNALWLADSGDPGRNGDAWELISWLTADSQLASFAAATGYVPYRQSAADHPTTVEAWSRLPQLRVGFDQLAGMPNTPAAGGLMFGPAVDFEQLLYGFTNEVMYGDGSIRAALVDLNERIDQLLADYASLSASATDP
jgi:sn-glycerol 3-phosphate transport system substrate-binding protein